VRLASCELVVGSGLLELLRDLVDSAGRRVLIATHLAAPSFLLPYGSFLPDLIAHLVISLAIAGGV